MPLNSGSAAARSGIAGTAGMPPGRAAALVPVLALAGRRLVGGVARRQGAARADWSAGSHRLARHAVAGQADVAGRAGVARPRGVAGCLRWLG